MASKPETTFTKSVEAHLPSKVLPYRMKNNNQYTGGIPDMWYSGVAGDLWVEYKFLPTMPQRGVMGPDRYNLSGLQLEWLRGRHEEGRTVAVVVGCPKGGVILRELEWEATMTAQEFLAKVVNRKSIALWITQTTRG